MAQEEQPVFHVVFWARDGQRNHHLIVNTLAAAVRAVEDFAASPAGRPSEEPGWVGETVQLRAWSGCRPWVQIFVGGRQATAEEHADRTAHLLRGVGTTDEARAALNEGPRPPGPKVD